MSELNAYQQTAREVRDLRTRLGLTQTQLAIRLGVSLPTIQRWERGGFLPSPLARQKLDELQRQSA